MLDDIQNNKDKLVNEDDNCWSMEYSRWTQSTLRCSK